MVGRQAEAGASIILHESEGEPGGAVGWGCRLTAAGWAAGGGGGGAASRQHLQQFAKRMLDKVERQLKPVLGEGVWVWGAGIEEPLGGEHMGRIAGVLLA